MARKIHAVEVEVDGEKQTFYYRKPSGRLMLRQSDKLKANELSNERSSEEMFAECVVNEDGSSITQDRVNEILDMDFDVLQQLNAVIMPPPKKEGEKNA